MKSFKVLMAVATLCMVIFGACSKKDDPASTTTPPDGTQYFGVKQATIVYSFADGTMTETVYFDNYGKQFRLEYDLGMDGGLGNETWIMDETAKKAYDLDVPNKTYKEVALADVQYYREDYLFTESSYTALTKSTETIAGKSCTAYSGSALGMTVLTSGWNGIIFHTMLNGADVLTATSFSETIPANMFTLPSGYTKE